jgi:hypothetical protein
MHVHGNQFDPNIQMNAVYAAARAEAKRAADRTRKSLLNAPSALAGEYDYEADCVVSLSGDDTSRGNANQGSAQYQGSQRNPNGQPDSGRGNDPLSYWA